MDFLRYVLLILENEDKKGELLNELSGWEYSEELERGFRAHGFSFVLINLISRFHVVTTIVSAAYKHL